MANDYRGITKRRKGLGNDSPTENAVQELGRNMSKDGGGTGGRNRGILAGFTFLGQFLGHDLTHDSGLSFEKENAVVTLHNFRTPALDLDSLYGYSPAVSPHLYDRDHQGKFLLTEGREFDLPRNPQGVALIGDPRNDRNLILSQLHLAFLKFHNAVFEQVRWINDGTSGDETRFEKAQRLVRWHYQWIIVREFLPLLVGSEMVHDILINGPKWYEWDSEGPLIPLEFSVAAYRFGHSQLHYLYRINDKFRLPLFLAKPPSQERQDLQGGPVQKEHTINWKHFFDTGVNPTLGWDRQSRKIGAHLTLSLLFPPASVALNRPEESTALATTSLAVRDLNRGQQRGLPSGQAVADAMVSNKAPVAVLHEKRESFEEALKNDKNLPPELQDQTPLWYYILKEAEVQHEGMRLGDVGGRIVAEVIIGLLREDPGALFYKGHTKGDVAHLISILQCISQEEIDALLQKGDTPEKWRPVLPIERNGTSAKGDFTMADLLRFAGVDTK